MQYATPNVVKMTAPEHKRPDVYSALPPHNFDAEQALLGALLIRNDSLERVIEIVDPSHFFDPLHAQLYEVIVRLVSSQRKADPITLKPFFEHSEPMTDGTTIPQYLGKLAVNATTTSNVADYAKVIRDMFVRRNLVLIGQDLVTAATEAHVDFPPEDQVEEAESRLYQLASTSKPNSGHIVDFGQAALKAWESIKAAKDGKTRALSTGLIDLDRKMGGLHPSNLVILAGRPSMGKTALALNIACSVADAGHFVDFYSLEMSDEELATRVLSARIRKASSDMRGGKLTPHMMEIAEKAVQSLASYPISIDKTGGISIAALAARARRNKRRRNTKLIIVDYLQLMQASKRGGGGNRVQDVAEITTGLKALAKELDVPVLALSQLSRNVEHRDNKRPQLSDLRESGSIEQDADIVLFVYRDEYYVERDRPADTSKVREWQQRLRETANKAEIVIGKQRHGETGTVEVAFNPALTQFSNLARQEVPHDRA